MVDPPLSMNGDPPMGSNASVEKYRAASDVAEQAHNPLDCLFTGIQRRIY